MMIIQKFNAYQTYTFEQKTFLTGAFNRINLEIRRIKLMLKEQKSFFFFKSHVYSKETLFNELHHSKILKILENINNITLLWNRRGVLTKEAINFFQLKHEEIQREFEMLQDEIARRESTWWEKICGAFREFINFVKENIPNFAVGFLMAVAKYHALEPFVSFFLPSPKLSPAEIRLLEEAKGSYKDVDIIVN